MKKVVKDLIFPYCDYSQNLYFRVVLLEKYIQFNVLFGRCCTINNMPIYSDNKRIIPDGYVVSKNAFNIFCLSTSQSFQSVMTDSFVIQKIVEEIKIHEEKQLKNEAYIKSL